MDENIPHFGINFLLVKYFFTALSSKSHFTSKNGLLGKKLTSPPVVLRVALCVGAAGVVDEAGVDAGAARAHLGVEALLVPRAADGLALDLRVADGALGAPAHRPVPQHEAVGARAAVAGVPAEPVDARLLHGALVVAHAARRVLQLHRPAAPVRHRHPAGPARADHGPEGGRLVNFWFLLY